MSDFDSFAEQWLFDFALKGCSRDARRLWTTLRCLMHRSDRRGYLRMNGKAPSLDTIADTHGASTEEISRLLEELKVASVIGQAQDGTWFDPGMVAREHKRALCAEAGRRGGGNPRLTAPLKVSLKGGFKGGVKRSPPEVSPPQSLPLPSPPDPGASAPAPTPRAREPDPVWDAVAGIWFPEGVTPPLKSRVGKLVREFKQHGATADDIRIRYERMRAKWGDRAESTPEALIKHWQQFRSEPPARQHPAGNGSQAASQRERRAETADRQHSRVGPIRDL